MTGRGPFHRGPQRFTLDQLGDVFLTACSLVFPVVAASMDWMCLMFKAAPNKEIVILPLLAIEEKWFSLYLT
jgi:hypothetical protein